MLRLGYCLPFLGTPHVPLFPSQCLFPAPSPSQGLFWSISPWSWFPRLLWSLLHSLLQASTAFCSWCCRPRGHGVRSSPSPISFSLWTCHTFSWGPFRLVPFFASCSVTRSTSYRLCTLASPRLRRSSPGSWLLFQLYSILWVSVCVDPSTHGRSSFWDCHPSQVFQPHTFPGSAVSVGHLRFHLFQGFSVGGSHLSAAICNRRIYVMRLAYRELVAVASRRSFFTSSPSSGRLAFFLRWLASFLAATWDCSPSSSASIVPGTVRIWRLQSWRRWSVFTVSSGGSFSLVSLSACLCTKCLLSFTFGQTPRTWVGAPISTVRSLRACRTPVRQRCLSMPGNC